MSPLRLNGSTSGYAELAASAAAGDVVLTIPNAAGTLDRLNRAGNILQVVQATSSTPTTIATETFTDTGLSASITPSSSSSKILVLASQPVTMSRQNTTVGVLWKLLRGSTDIYAPAAANYFYLGSTTTDTALMLSYKYLDSPATTSSVIYKTQARMSSNSSSGTMTLQGANQGASSIILLEVAA